MLKTTVVIIGGGATGIGILRDASMRGIPAILVEQGGIASGASSRFHGLLHSGGRYAVKDREAAKECITENLILKKIAAGCVEKTEGFFVRTEEDDPEYEPTWVESCKLAGIATEPITVKEALKIEPNLSPSIKSVYKVPDSAIDGFRLVWHNAMSARHYGGEMLTHHRVTGIDVVSGKVKAVKVVNTITGEEIPIYCDMVVNAAGSWAGKIVNLVNLNVSVQPDRGTLIAFNHRFFSRVVNRLHKSSDGDIFVPHGTITILGTTSFKTDDPAAQDVPTKEIIDLLNIGQVLVPHLRDYRILRVFAGTRPLYVEKNSASGRSASRGFHISDHSEEGLDGMISIFGGKFTTYRLMAEKATDLLCRKLHNNARCRTAEEPLVKEPDRLTMEKAKKFFPVHGISLAKDRLGEAFPLVVSNLTEKQDNPLVCECELVTKAEVEFVAHDPSTNSINDLRMRTRLGMGTCQGAFCTLRSLGFLSDCHIPYELSPRKNMEEFLQERWKGIRPALWGIQAKEVELARALYSLTLNIDGAKYDQKN